MISTLSVLFFIFGFAFSFIRYGEEAAKAASEGLDAAGHAVGTAWTVFKIRQALNPKSVLKPTALTKSAAKSAAKKKGKSSK